MGERAVTATSLLDGLSIPHKRALDVLIRCLVNVRSASRIKTQALSFAVRLIAQIWYGLKMLGIVHRMVPFLTWHL
jgi:hypothetical protein